MNTTQPKAVTGEGNAPRVYLGFRIGDAVRYLHYGESRIGVITGIGESGKIVFVDGRWLHSESIKSF